jgi:phosphate transport system substrate-binding protein
MRTFTVVSVAAAIALAGCSSGGSATPELGAECSLKNAYAIAETSDGFISCRIVDGTSIHGASDDTKARFVWQPVDNEQWEIAQASNMTIRIDGSSTVAPLMAVAAKYFEQATKSAVGANNARAVVGISGTGGGFQKFCAGETDIQDASRRIRSSEVSTCSSAGVEYVEMPIANDGLAIVVNKDNDWAKCLTMDEVEKIWERNSTVTNWSQIRAGFPDVPIALFGAGTDSGTFESFAEFAVGGSDNIRRQGVQTSEDDNVTIRGVTGSRGGMGYLGLSYVEENAGIFRAVSLDGGNGCIEPISATVQDASYPMARPLYVYAKVSSLKQSDAVLKFVRFLVSNLEQISEDALFVPLTAAQIETLSSTVAELSR